mmetsp:Transcript_50675/g.109439  ORF Transcript_50675/g.109439 Transcript_50675/m.109439 type:complete len:458 (-) Transcript_50675:125-1498(-)|eukprot:CAMPEP_0206463916 /NCGR_PEP_ID=MMETSP0324_2-20121206/26898_1 /ASSEMBLY_ACC=CAM_ASM_000836 /TAXON_ID=2866 /ORGANISM="Crypthecodinium cohnii, Strain Seligo" /LENGTH=457 /DNA_ID=CAMNT_0053936433 /DNA_START=43 /DNA_END=1416 /DNA_ORIENTATION=+
MAEQEEAYEGEYDEEDEEYYSDAGGDDDKADGRSESSGSSRGPPRLQLDPLQIRFSQKKMRNVFGDGKKVEEAVLAVQTIRRSKEEEELYDAAWKLEAPFPPIEVLRWRCKLRDEKTGRPLLNERGKEMFEAEESWFTLDNRRLYCLQKAALKLLREEGPQAHCTACVIAEVRKDRRMREIRKFRTMDNGQSVMVGSIIDGVPFQRWDWRLEYKDPNRTDADRHVPFKQRTGKGKKGKGKGKDPDADNSKGGGGGKNRGKGGKEGGGKASGKHVPSDGSSPATASSDAHYPIGGVLPDATGKGGMDFTQFAAAYQTAGGKGQGGKDTKGGRSNGGGKGKQQQQQHQQQHAAYSYSQDWDKYPSYSDYYATAAGYYGGGGGGGGAGDYYGAGGGSSSSNNNNYYGAHAETGKGGSKGAGKSTKGKIGGGSYKGSDYYGGGGGGGGYGYGYNNSSNYYY